MTDDGETPPMALTWRGIDAIPLVHGRLAFALEVRRRLLEERYDAVAVELPASLGDVVLRGVDDLPIASLVLYREQPEFMGPQPIYYVPVQPGDGVIEALRIARGERLPTYFVDAEIEGFQPRGAILPDPYALHTLGLETFVDASKDAVSLHRARREGKEAESDLVREMHMAARLTALSEKHEKILFVCGMAHWASIRSLLENGAGELDSNAGIPREQVWLGTPEPGTFRMLSGEIPYVVEAYEGHRAGWTLDDFDVVAALKDLLIEARALFLERFPGSLERPDPPALRTLLDFARRLTVRRGYLIPDTYTLVVAANGVVGNDFALVVAELANRYRPNGELMFAMPPQVGGDTGEGTGDEIDGAGGMPSPG